MTKLSLLFKALVSVFLALLPTATPKLLAPATAWRGGMSTGSHVLLKIANTRGGNGETDGSVEDIIISVFAGSRFLDRQKKIRMPRSASVGMLKAELQRQFPGNPPVMLQELYYGVRMLKNEDLISNITSTSPKSLTLDLLSGTGSYNRSAMSVTDAIDCIVALEVHSAANSLLYAEICGGRKRENETLSRTILCRDLYNRINNSFYKTYSKEISAALVAERDPEKESTDTAAWSKGKLELDKNASWRERFFMVPDLKLLVFNVLSLLCFAYFGTSSVWSQNAVIMGLWAYLLSRMRPIRLYIKALLYLMFSQLENNKFILPLLPAPYQALAIYFYEDSQKFNAVSETDDGGGDEGRNNVPRKFSEAFAVAVSLGRRFIENMWFQLQSDKQSKFEDRDEEIKYKKRSAPRRKAMGQ